MKHKRGSAQNYLALPKGVQVSAIGLDITAKLSYDQSEQVGAMLQGVHKSILWWIEDYLVYGQARFREEFTQTIVETWVTAINRSSTRNGLPVMWKTPDVGRVFPGHTMRKSHRWDQRSRIDS